MAAGAQIKHKRKASAFAGGELAAGEFGLNTNNGIWYYSLNGTDTVSFGTMANQNASAVAITGGSITGVEAASINFTIGGLRIGDNTAPSSQYLIIRPENDQSAIRTLSVYMNGADREVTFAGVSSISGTNTGDVTLAGENYLSIASQVITAGAVTLSGTHVTGTLPATKGGTGQTVYAVGDLLYASTSTALSKLADVATGKALISGGVGVAPSWGDIGISTHVSGLGTNVAAALGNTLNAASGLVGFSGALGTPTSGTMTNVSGTAASLVAGSATILATSRTIWGQSFNGSANITGAFLAAPSGSPATDDYGASISTTNTGNAANNGLYGVLAYARQSIDRTASNGNLYGAKFQAQAAATLQTAYGIWGNLTVDSTKTVTDGGAVLFSLNNSGTITTFKALNQDLVNAGTVGEFYGTYLRVINNGPITGFHGFKIELANSGSTITTAKGLEFDGYSIGSGITTNYLIYAGTSTAIGTTKYGIYFLPDMQSYHVGKFGIGSGVTSATARLQVRDTTEPLRVEYDASNYWNAITNSTGVTTFDAVGSGTGATIPRFVFADEVVLRAGTATAGTPPLKFQSGTNLTTAEAGACEYDGAVFYQTTDTTSGRGQVPVEQYFYLNADGSTISTIANFFGSTSNVSLVANAYYEIEIFAYFLNTTSGTVTWTFTNSAAPTSQNMHFRFSPIGGVNTTTGGVDYLHGDIVKDATATKALSATGTLTSAVNHQAHFKIWLKNGTGTSLKIQATKNVGGTITPLTGSYYKCRRLPAATTGTFAA